MQASDATLIFSGFGDTQDTARTLRMFTSRVTECLVKSSSSGPGSMCSNECVGSYWCAALSREAISDVRAASVLLVGIQGIGRPEAMMCIPLHASGFGSARPCRTGRFVLTRKPAQVVLRKGAFD